MPSSNPIENINIVNVVLNILLGLVAGYITLLSRSIRKEAQLKIDGVKDLYGKHLESCNEKWTETKTNVSDLLVRARVLGTLEERLHSGAEQFSEIKRRLDDIEFILFKKGRR